VLDADGDDLRRHGRLRRIWHLLALPDEQSVRRRHLRHRHLGQLRPHLRRPGDLPATRYARLRQLPLRQRRLQHALHDAGGLRTGNCVCQQQLRQAGRRPTLCGRRRLPERPLRLGRGGRSGCLLQHHLHRALQELRADRHGGSLYQRRRWRGRPTPDLRRYDGGDVRHRWKVRRRRGVPPLPVGDDVRRRDLRHRRLHGAVDLQRLWPVREADRCPVRAVSL
jgi:hypothetical protein